MSKSVQIPAENYYCREHNNGEITLTPLKSTSITQKEGRDDIKKVLSQQINV